MLTVKQDIKARLEREILPLQGYRPLTGRLIINTGLDQINESFPEQRFPVGAIHEFICSEQNDMAATTGFIAGLLSPLMRTGGVCVWISANRKLFPPALKFFDISPEKIIFIDLHHEKDVIWAMEEALKCGALAGVIAETKELTFTASRRFQLSVEQSQVTGFVIRERPPKINPTACIARWKISSLSSESDDELPGVGFPQWRVELLKVRNGKPGSWQVRWLSDRFHPAYKLVPLVQQQHRKTG